LYVLLGVKLENIIMFDSHGVLSNDRDDLSHLQRRYCRGEKGINLKVSDLAYIHFQSL